MDWCNPSDDSEAIITPQAQIEDFLSKRGSEDGFGANERLLMLHTGFGVESLQSCWPVREEPFPVPAFLRKFPLYAVETDPPISLVEKVFGAPMAVDVLEVAIAMGARQLFFFGLCGAIGDDLEIGDVVIPVEVKREEGTSYHYLPAKETVKPNRTCAGLLEEFLAKHEDIRVHTGHTVSTDAVFRQTLNKERGWRDEGIIAVDMEMSAMLAVAQFHKLPAVSVLVVSDKHILKEQSEWNWGGQKLVEARAKMIRLFAEFIMSIGETEWK